MIDKKDEPRRISATLEDAELYALTDALARGAVSLEYEALHSTEAAGEIDALYEGLRKLTLARMVAQLSGLIVGIPAEEIFRKSWD